MKALNDSGDSVIDDLVYWMAIEYAVDRFIEHSNAIKEKAALKAGRKKRNLSVSQNLVKGTTRIIRRRSSEARKKSKSLSKTKAPLDS
ncbi:hypothetical protein [Pseudomonas oryzihabitans]|uniref:hypothetical protein n=1 Tax=Pseudomonas oryzihabitans TaxID=47885 RepID=UPI002893A231|nr:hypothetical protein [Pseudomonas oryzihabitans]MDT3723010.1 hypothetical protein [Pseudomonas oryzihabitans]